MIAFRSVLKTLLKCNHLPFKTLKEWEDAQKDEPLETLETLQKSLTREIKRKKAEKKQASIHERWAEKHGYKLESVKSEDKKPKPTKAAEALKEIVTPGEVKPEDKKPATAGAKPFI